MSVVEQQNVTELVQKPDSVLASQEKFAVKLGCRSKRQPMGKRTSQTLPLALRQIEALLEQMGDRGADLLVKHFGSEDKLS